MTLWDDDGPISQGKILTAVLQDRNGEALKMLQGWSRPDLDTLIKAIGRLQYLAIKTRAMKEIRKEAR